MLKSIPPSDISEKKFYAYKQWVQTDSDSPVYKAFSETGSMAFEESTATKIGNIYTSPLWHSIKTRYYSSNGNVLSQAGIVQNPGNFNEERTITDTIYVIDVPQINYGEEIKKGSVLLNTTYEVQTELTAVPVIESYSTASTDGTRSTTLTFSDAPSGLEAGDLILLLIANDRDNFWQYEEISGYTLTPFPNNIRDTQLGVYYRIATGDSNDGFPNLTVTHSATTVSAVGWAVRISGVDTSDPIPQFGVYTSGSGVGNEIPSPITTLNDDSLVIMFHSINQTDRDPITIIEDAGFVSEDFAEDDSGDPSIGVYAEWWSKEMPTAGYTGDVELNHAQGWGNVIFEIQSKTTTAFVSQSSAYTDDGYGNMKSGGSIVGNVFYDDGLVVMTDVPEFDEYELRYRSTQLITETEVLITVGAGEFNISQNPTAVDVTLLQTSSFETTDYRNVEPGGTIRIKEVLDIRQKQEFYGTVGNTTGSWNDYFEYATIDPTGSYLTPYITTIGFYDDNYDMVAIAKLPTPIKNLPDSDLNFIVRFDT